MATATQTPNYTHTTTLAETLASLSLTIRCATPGSALHRAAVEAYRVASRSACLARR